jgi:hypothetical protein
MRGGAEEVRLLIPAAPGYLRLARLTAAAVASRMGFTFDEVEDLRIAVDELCYYVLDTDGEEEVDGSITLTCTIGDGDLEVRGEATAPTTAGRSDSSLPELSRRILEAVVDEYSCDTGGDAARFWLRKRRAAT